MFEKVATNSRTLNGTCNKYSVLYQNSIRKKTYSFYLIFHKTKTLKKPSNSDLSKKKCKTYCS